MDSQRNVQQCLETSILHQVHGGGSMIKSLMSKTEFKRESSQRIPFRTARIKLRRLEDILNDKGSLLRSDHHHSDFGYGCSSEVNFAAGSSACREDNAALDAGGDPAQKGGPRNRIWRPSNINCSSPEKIHDAKLDRVVPSPRGDQPTCSYYAASDPTPKDHHLDTVASPKESSSEPKGFRDVDEVQEICTGPEISAPPSENGVSKRRRLRKLSDRESSKQEKPSKELQVEPASRRACDFDLNQPPSPPPSITWNVAPYKPKKQLYSRYMAERKAFEESDSDDARSIDCDVEIEAVLRSLRKELFETVDGLESELDDSISEMAGARQDHMYDGIFRKDCANAGVRYDSSPITKPRDGQFSQTISRAAELRQLARRARVTYEYKRVLLKALKRGRWRVSYYVRTNPQYSMRLEQLLSFIKKRERIRLHGCSYFTSFM